MLASVCRDCSSSSPPAPPIEPNAPFPALAPSRSHRALDHQPDCRRHSEDVRRALPSGPCRAASHQLEWTPQKPETRALERDDTAIEQWKREAWPRVKIRRLTDQR
ncbi:MAG: winged helix-turn-helix domain-containing protein [Candidatus Rokubacteria bacterium]|nr:winged helix-turn-helix domain-containing protein [Candidatus Rokubacteria bacterium]